MKKQKLKKASFWSMTVTLAVSLFFVGLTSCEKENYPLKSTTYTFSSREFADLYDRLPEIDYGSLSVVGDGILRFQSFDHFESIYDNLERNCEIWDSIFLVSHANLSNSELEDYEILHGYDEFLPLVIFEHNYDISNTSLRKAQSDAYNNWLNNNLKGEMPFDSLIIDDVEQTLFNVFHEVCIGDTIYSLRREGVILIPLDSVNNLRKYRQLSFEDISAIFPVIQKAWDGTIEFAYIPAGKNDTLSLSSTECVCVATNSAAWFRMNNSTKPKVVSKIINQKYKASQNKWVKTRRWTALELSVFFYWERYDINTGLQADNGLSNEIDISTQTKNKRTMKVKAKDSITEESGYDYYYGVKRDPQLIITINNIDHPLPIVFY